jgi:hypothetical protein
MATKTFTKEGISYSAVQYDGGNYNELSDFLKDVPGINVGGSMKPGTPVVLLTSEKPYKMEINDWIFREEDSFENIFRVGDSDIDQYQEVN